jgi:hypothetical protein
VGHEFAGSNKVVATQVVYLRRKLAGTGPELIHTQRASVTACDVTEVAAAHGGTAEAAPAPSHGLRITLTVPVEQPAPALPPTKTELADTATACVRRDRAR